MSRRNQVAIVGGSIAGLYAGYRLASAGVPVTIYEARETVNPAPRTLIVTPAWLHLLDFDAEPAVLNRICLFELISRSERARISLADPDLIVERRRFVELLSSRLARAGGRILVDHRLEELARLDGGYELRIRSGRQRIRRLASHAIGADGIQGTTVRVGRTGAVPSVALLQARVPIPKNLDPTAARIVFDRSSTRFFYWIIPESDETAVAGLIHETDRQAREALARFLSAQDLAPIDYQEARTPLHAVAVGNGHTRADRNLMLVGDAAGQVKTTTVGGVVAGMRGAAAASRAILGNATYARELRTLDHELNAHGMLRGVLDGFTDDDYDALLRLINSGAARALAERSRDELSQGLWWRLVRAQPRWLRLGLRAVARKMTSHA